MTGKTFPFTRTDEEWRQVLTPEQYQVMRAHGAELPAAAPSSSKNAPARFPAPAAGSLCSHPK